MAVFISSGVIVPLFLSSQLHQTLELQRTFRNVAGDQPTLGLGFGIAVMVMVLVFQSSV